MADEIDPDLRQIVEAISACAEEEEKEPCDVSITEFRTYQARWHMRIPRATVQKFGGFLAIKACHFPPKATKEARLKRKIAITALANNRVGRKLIDESEVYAEVEAWARKTFFRGGDITTPRPIARQAKASIKAAEINRWVIVDIGDMHCGGDIKGEHTGSLDYGPQEEARRMAQVVAEVCDFNTAYRRETGLIVIWGGDLIEGEIHPNTAAPLSQQISRSMWLGFQAEEHFSRAFRAVHNVCISGNHGDFAGSHGVPDKLWDTHEMTIYQSMRMHLADRANVSWHIPQAAFAVFNVFGKNFYVVHGHAVIELGSPDRTLDIARITQQIDKLNASAIDIGGYEGVFGHHVHTPLSKPLDNGTHLVINGAFTPINSYSKSRGYHRSACRQFLAEMTRDYPIGDQRWVTLDSRVDADKSLDKIVKTWKDR